MFRARSLTQALIVSLGFAMVSHGANATIIELKPDGITGKDAQISDGSTSSSNFGSSTDLIINWGGNLRSVGLIEFDLSAVTPGSTINSATLDLFHITNGCLNCTYDVFQVTSAWDESTVTFDTAPSFDPTAIASLTIGDGGVGVYRQWDVTSLVADWVSGTETNYGFWIEEFPVSGASYAYFSSSDIAEENRRPMLTIDYTSTSVPEPATTALLGLGLLGLFGSRKSVSA